MRDPMPYIMLGATLFLIIAMVLMLIRLIGGPSLYDRLLALNSFGTKTVLFMCVFGFIIDRPDGIDIALLYALMNFIATIAVLKFFNYGALNIDLRKGATDASAEDQS
jgi:multicomponent Na+:H+ antiporter subunit F